MSSGSTVADRLAAALSTVLGAEQLPWRLRAWDGSEAGPVGAPVLDLRSPMAVRRLVWAPGELGLSRAYVAGDIDMDGDVFATLDALAARLSTGDPFPRPGPRQWLDLARTAAVHNDSVAAPIRTLPAGASACNRDAVLTTSPIAV